MCKYLETICKRLYTFSKNILSPPTIYYVSDGANWILDDIGKSIAQNITNLHFGTIISTVGTRNSIIHYSSIGCFILAKGYKLPHKSNKIVITWFHVVDGKNLRKQYPDILNYVDIWHTASIQHKKKLINLGLPSDKIVLIPIGLDLGRYQPVSLEEKKQLKKQLNVPGDKIIIGSFQKDGNGWGEGLEPKLIKGPDVLCDVLERIATKLDIFVVLTGPARGYVKKRLERAKIPYLHDHLFSPGEVCKYYQICDLYIMASREEGGPRALTESMACGVPIVSTKTGMAEDIIIDGINGFLTEIEDVEQIVEKSFLVLQNNELRRKVIANGFETVQKYDYSCLAREYESKIYSQLL